MKEYMAINKPVLQYIVALGSDSALVSDAARAWLEIKQHYDQLPRNSLQRMSKDSPASDLAQLKALVNKRVDKSLTDGHYLALFLDPRPSMRKFVKDSKLAGDESDMTLGNTDALHRAKDALKAMAPALTTCRKEQGEADRQTDAMIVQALYQALLTYLEVGLCLILCAL
jgi:hypothetical protein